jgi:hypothetical protein
LYFAGNISLKAGNVILCPKKLKYGTGSQKNLSDKYVEYLLTFSVLHPQSISLGQSTSFS